MLAQVRRAVVSVTRSSSALSRASCSAGAAVADTFVFSYVARSAFHTRSVVLAPKPKKGAAVDETFTPDSGTDAVTGVDPAHLKPLLNKSIDYAKREFAKLRGGTATPREWSEARVAEQNGQRGAADRRLVFATRHPLQKCWTTL